MEENKAPQEPVFDSATLHIQNLPKDTKPEELTQFIKDLNLNLESVSIKNTSASAKFASEADGKSRLYNSD